MIGPRTEEMAAVVRQVIIDVDQDETLPLRVLAKDPDVNPDSVVHKALAFASTAEQLKLKPEMFTDRLLTLLGRAVARAIMADIYESRGGQALREE